MWQRVLEMIHRPKGYTHTECKPLKRRRERGFSIIELSIVGTIIAVVAGGVVGGSHFVKQAQNKSVLGEVQKIVKAAR
ncbi:MAG: hypothetical protein K0R63_1536, partial [Rickettsiales bacterium]|nr:hypothetical protein [Rickettsiales bacterium]